LNRASFADKINNHVEDFFKNLDRIDSEWSQTKDHQQNALQQFKNLQKMQSKQMTSHDMYEPLIIQLSRQINEVEVTNDFFGSALAQCTKTFNEQLQYIKFNYSALQSSVKSGKHSITTTEEFKFKDVGDKKSVLLEAHDDLWDHNLKKLNIEELLELSLTQIYWNEN
tara:strand:- start:474 stop:977 length:504 start_codon:yes stop_codon:yes gene_type:complete